MQEILKTWRMSILDPITVVIVATAVMVATVSGPFGTHEALSAVPRFLFWGVVVTSAAILGVLVRVAVHLRVPQEKRLISEALTTVIFTGLFGGALVLWVNAFAAYFGVEAYVPAWWRQIGYVAIITVLLLAIRSFVFRVFREQARALITEESSSTVQQSGEAATEPFEPRLMRRLPMEERAPILWLSAEDHIVEVHTRIGVVRLRMRLKDAIDEMEGVEGYCTHRSHWVARGAIVSSEKKGNTWSLRLSNGKSIPVSRKYQPVLTKAGYLTQSAAE